MSVKQFFFIISLVTSVFFVKAQTAPDIQWKNCYGGFSLDESYAVQQTTDGGFILAGYTSSPIGDGIANHGNFDFWIVKLNSIGAIEWQKCLGGSNNEYAASIIQVFDGGYIVAGTTSSTDGDVSGNHGVNDCWVVKLNNTGTIEWQKCFGGSDNDYMFSIVQTTDGGCIAAGQSGSADGDVTGHHGGTGFRDYWIVKLSNTGSMEWQKSLGGTADDMANSIVQTIDGGFVVAGKSNSNNGDVSGNHSSQFDYWVVKLNNAGNIVWQKCYGGIYDDVANSIKQTSDSGYIVCGVTNSPDGDVTLNHGLSDCWIIKLDKTGNIEWQKCYGGSGQDGAMSIDQTVDSGYVFAGYSFESDGDVTSNNGLFDYWVVKLNNSGNLQWQKSLGGNYYDFANDIKQTNTNNYIVVGRSESNNGDVTGSHGQSECWVLKFGPFIPVPIIFSNFNADKNNEGVLLSWQTETESNTKDFVIERSKNTTDFETISNVPAAGNSTNVKNYCLTDLSPHNGLNYYRLKQIDRDGSFLYSKTVVVNFSKKAAVVYPNPASTLITINGADQLNLLEIINAEGKLVLRMKPSANNQYNISSLPKGMYSLKLLYNDSYEIIKLSKQ